MEYYKGMLPVLEYRAWDSEEKVMLDNVLLAGKVLLIEEEDHDVEDDSCIAGKWYRQFGHDDGFIIMAGTGRNLGKGGKLFAADILEWTDSGGHTRKGYIAYSRQYCGWMCGGQALCSILTTFTYDSIKLLGNMFAHPKVAKGKPLGLLNEDCMMFTPGDIEKAHWSKWNA